MPGTLKLSGGTLIDGTGAAGVRADVAIAGGRIHALGDLAALEAARTIDCSNRVVAPGFIDIHSHSDWLLPDADHGRLVEPFVRQGVTTLVAGNCGFSPAPVSARSRESARGASRLLHDGSLDPDFATMGSFLDALERGGVALNVAQLVGHGTVRAAVTGALEAAAPGRRRTGSDGASRRRGARRRLRGNLHRARLRTGHLRGRGGARGVREDGVAPRQALHLASEGVLVGERRLLARSEAGSAQPDGDPRDPARGACGRGAAPDQPPDLRRPPHLAESPRGVAAVEDARREGLDVAFDAFPYTAGNTTCAVIFPAALLPKLEEVLRDPAQLAGLARFAEVAFEAIGFGLPDIQLMHCDVPEWNHLDGLRIPEAAARVGMEPFEFYARLTVASHRNARVLNHTYSGDAGDEEALRAVLAHPLCTIETDTILTGQGHQNPASFGTFPRVLSTYVRAGLFSLEEAVRKMTGAAAERLGWRDRGTVHRGAAADLVVFDPTRLRDTASFETPARAPEGIESVLVNGDVVLDAGRYDASARAGAVLRS